MRFPMKMKTQYLQRKQRCFHKEFITCNPTLKKKKVTGSPPGRRTMPSDEN
jgi:hypothetical protein